MQLICIGVSHQTASVDIREKFAVPDAQAGAVSCQLAQKPGVPQAVVISTCNRVEYYAVAENVHAHSIVRDALCLRSHGADPAGVFELCGAAAARHLFRVVSGLESMVLGETEILGQTKKAYAHAHAAGATGRHLNKLFQRAFRVAKEVRTNTNITRGSVSVGSVAVDLAEKIFGDLKECRAMILGAGEMSELTATALKSRGVQAVFVANRSYERAVSLAATMHGRALHFDEWQSNFHDIDILIGSTAAPHPVLTADQLAPIMRTRADRPLFCIDLAVPRDIDPAVNAIDGVYLYDIDSLQAIADHSMHVRRQELAICEEMIERHVAEFVASLDFAQGTMPTPAPAACDPPIHVIHPQGAQS
jgi:glutamyl-tRNA reductase